MRNLGLSFLGFAALAFAAGCSSDDSTSGTGGAGGSSGSGGIDGGAECAISLAPASSGSDVQPVQDALIALKTGETLCLTPGTYKFDKLITLNGTKNVTVKGTGATRDDVVLDFAGQTSGNDAFTVQADGFTVQNLTVKDPPGDGVKVTSSDRPTFRNVRAYYSAGSVKGNGAYALYPAESTNVLIEECEVEGSSDAAIYLGQSTTGIVRNNKAHGCVIGLEAENSTDVEIYGNEAYGNTCGILIVNLPNLPKQGCQRISVHDNDSHENDHENFGDGFAGALPPGVGVVITASDNVEFASNQVHDNSGPGVMLLSWPTVALIAGLPANDPNFNQFSTEVNIHDNTFSGNGQAPSSTFSGPPLSFTTVEDIFWDGALDPAASPALTEDTLCLRNNGSATFRNLHGLDGVTDPTKQTTSLTPHDCTKPAIAPVTLSSQ